MAASVTLEPYKRGSRGFSFEKKSEKIVSDSERVNLTNLSTSR